MIVLIGVLPPPVSGAPMVTAAIGQALGRRGARLAVIDLSAWGRLEQTPATRLLRSLRVIAGLWRMATLALRGPAGIAYIALSGGFGRYYDIAYAALARWAGMRLVLHHHSAGCLEVRGTSTALLCRVAGREAAHLVQCKALATALVSRYAVGTPRVLSNAFAVPEAPVRSRDGRGGLTIGYLGNIVESKGIFEFLAVVAALGQSMPATRALVAGPLQDRRLGARFRAALQAAPAAEYLGPVGADGKAAFFETIDVLLFPSRFFHEAEPVTILEALSHGVPVIAIGRGCIATLLNDAGGLVLPGDASFAGGACAALHDWRARPGELARRSAAAHARFGELRRQSVSQLDAILEGLA